ncbi:MAG TPA: hypothetical protein VFE35_05770 [Candidatus Cybelea sp.]|jgi:hypothetical protein|nr:hypothetical protein [Candidatus Cybelea sp.]
MRLFAVLSILLAPAVLAPVPAAVRSAPGQATASPSPVPLSPDALFSRRALRRAKLLIQMRMFQLRNERLECVRAALLRQLPAALRPQEPTTWSSAHNPPDACLRQM